MVPRTVDTAWENQFLSSVGEVVCKEASLVRPLKSIDRGRTDTGFERSCTGVSGLRAGIEQSWRAAYK